MTGIYAIINKINGKMYVGSTKNLHKRKIHHFSDLKRNKHHNEHLQQAFNKYSEENFEFKELEHCIENNLMKREQHYINHYNTTNRNCGYNLALKADRSIMSNETKNKISKAHSKYLKYKVEMKILYKRGMEIPELAEKFGCARITVYEYLRGISRK